MAKVLNLYKSYFTNKEYVIASLLALAMLLVSVIINFYAGMYANRAASNTVTDVILSHVRVYDLDSVFVYGTLLFALFTAGVLLSKPKYIPFTLKSISLFVLIRACFFSLTHTAPFADQPHIASHLLWFSNFTGDLFFSGHTGMPFLLALIFWEQKILRMVFVACSVGFGVVVLLMHLHYSIDVLSAFFIAYTIYHLAERAFKKDKKIFAADISYTPSRIENEHTVIPARQYPKISFVIPAYNEESYLARCLAEIVRQKETAPCVVEVIVVNNASTDQTREVALTFPDVRVVEELRKGLPYARQAGLEAATGDIIAQVDADSILAPHWIEKVIERFEDSPRLVALSGPIIYYDMPLAVNLLLYALYTVPYGVYLVNRFVLRKASWVVGSNLAVKRSELVGIGGYDTTLSFHGEDADIARRLPERGPVVFSWSMPMYSSGRRLQHQGFVSMSVIYGLNYFWTLCTGRPYTQHFSDTFRTSAHTGYFKTTVHKLNRTITMLKLASGVCICLSVIGLYSYNKVLQLSSPSVAEAKTITMGPRTTRVVHALSPVVLTVHKKVQNIRNDTDDMPVKHH